MEQRTNIKFCFKLGKSATETYEMIKKVYGEDAMSRSRVFEWFARFKAGRESTEDDERTGRPRSSRMDENIERVQTLVKQDRRMTIAMIAETLNLSVGSVFTIMTGDLKKRKLCARFVPHSLTREQKEQRVAACEDLIAKADQDPNFLQNIVTGDESWCLEYDPETKRQSAEWTSPGKKRPMKVRASKSRTKTMLITFFDGRGIIHREFLRQGSTVTGAFYKDVLDRLLKRMRRVRPELLDSGNWWLLHDNAPAHKSIIVQEFLAKREVVCINHPPYSPDLSPPDYFLFPKLKLKMKGQRYESIESIEEAVTRELNGIEPEAFQRAMGNLYTRSKQCIALGGDYVEA